MKIDYSTIVGITKERNRPSGGIKTVHTIISNAFLDKKSKVLEIGSNTGFTSVNIATLVGCKVFGIDINKESLQEAKRYAKANKVSKLTKFTKASATNLPFKDQEFDLVWCSNVASFIKNKKQMMNECLRVLKINGILSIIPIYYRKKPPINILNQVSEIIGTKILITDKKYWIELVKNSQDKYNLDLFFQEDFKYIDQKKRIPEFVNEIFEKKHLKKVEQKRRKLLKEEYTKMLKTFNKNLKYAGYSILLFQKRMEKEETELFYTEEASPKD